MEDTKFCKETLSIATRAQASLIENSPSALVGMTGIERASNQGVVDSCQTWKQLLHKMPMVTASLDVVCVQVCSRPCSPQWIISAISPGNHRFVGRRLHHVLFSTELQAVLGMDLAQDTTNDSLRNQASVVDRLAATGVKKTNSDPHELRHALSVTSPVCVIGGKDVVRLRLLGWRRIGRVEAASLAKVFPHQLLRDSVFADNFVKMLEAIAELMDQRQRVQEAADGCEEDGQDVVDEKSLYH